MKKIILMFFILISINAISQVTVPPYATAPNITNTSNVNSLVLQSNTPYADIIQDVYFGGTLPANAVKASWIYTNEINNGQCIVENFINVKEHGVKGDGSTDDAVNLQSIINNTTLVPPDVVTVLYFPAGVYLFKSGIVLEKVSVNQNIIKDQSNIIIKGDGGASNLSCFTKFNFNFNATHHGSIFKLNNVENIGIEDLYIYRNDYGNGNTSISPNSNGIEMNNVKNCWIRGVHSENAWKNHVYLNNCIGVSITGCYFFDAQVRGDGGEGYGIVMQGVGNSTNPYSTHFCLIENNIFQNLRHSIVMQQRPQQNVIGYNYAFDNFQYLPPFYTPLAMPELSFHGKMGESWGPCYNLIEGNMFERVKFDMTHLENGPYNTLFRTNVWDFDISDWSISNPNHLANDQQYMQNIVGTHSNDLTTENFASEFFTHGLYLCSGPVSDCWTNSQYSYYKSSKPDFLDTWPFMPDSDINGAQKRFQNSNSSKVVYEGWEKYSIYPMVINTNTIWNTEKTIRNNYVEISPNCTLTIQNCRVNMPKNGAFLVKAGGKLIIDGSIIIGSYCDTYYNWEGITVEGDKTKSQFDLTKHGIVELKNNSIIHSAITGIKTKDINNPNLGGGIIKAYNSSFINNQISIKLNPYQNKSISGYNFFDLSTIKNCTFAINYEYKNPLIYPFNCFVELNSINGIEIKGCNFRNMRPDIAADFSNAGIGIKSNESDFTVDNYINQSEFYNLQYGIKSITTNLLKHFMVKNTYFENNLHGIYSYNSYNNWFTGNTFKIPDYYVPGTNNTVFSAYGLYLDHCSDYIVEGNTFNKLEYLTNATYGLIINESGANNNTVYNNSFQNIEYAASQMQGKNKAIPTATIPNPPLTGIQILCNDYSGNKQDISIVPVVHGGGISIFQGTAAFGNSPEERKKPAGNTFSKFGPTSTDYTDLKNGGANLYYYHHAGSTTNIWVPEFCNDEPVINKVATLAIRTNKEETCPGIALQTGSNFPYEPLQLNSIIQQKTAQLNTSKLIYSLWVDNGNTEGLRHDIKISASWDAFDLYNELLLGSPKLSEEVLIDAIKREDVLTPLMLKLILLANPQSTRSDRVWEALLNRSNPLPEAWIDEIKQGLEVISPIENMQADISYYASESNTYMNLLKQCYLSDTTEIGMQQYLSLLDNESDIESKYELVFAKIGNQDYERALSTLSSIETMIDREKYPEESDRHAKMTNLIPVLITIETSHTKWEELSENDRNLLINLSETDYSVTGSLATACRMTLDAGFVYEEPIYMPSNKPLKMALPKKGKTAIANEQQIKISPNPATDYIAIECNTEGFCNNLRLQISDAMGKTVLEKELGKAQQIIDIREFAKGNYYCTVYNNNKPLHSVKFIKK